MQIEVSDAVVGVGDTVFFPLSETKLGAGRVEYVKGRWVGVRSDDGRTPAAPDQGRVDEWQPQQLVFQPWRRR